MVGEQNAQHAFLFGYQAVMEISQIVKEINSNCDFTFKPCFLYTQDPRKVDYMADECKSRQAIGIHCELFTSETHQNEFSFNFEAGVYGTHPHSQGVQPRRPCHRDNRVFCLASR